MGIEFEENAVTQSKTAPLPPEPVRIMERMVQIGRVMAVDEKKHAARVKFEDTGIRSGWLKIVDNRPYFPDYDEELTEKFHREPECERVRWEENEDTGEKDILIVETEDIIYPFDGEEPEPAPDPEPEPEPEPEEDGEEDGEGGEGGGGDGSGDEEPLDPEPAESESAEPEPDTSGEQVTPEEGDEYGGIRSHSNKVKTRMWMPHIDDMVLCLYLPIRNGDGFILGKIWQ